MLKLLTTRTAVTMIAEIINIQRFPREDSLACYSGLEMAARNFVQYNPDSHLTGYHRNLVKRGMSALEATKRVARALVRVVYRELSALVAQQPDMPATAQKKEGEGDMASGLTRSNQSHPSNISPSSLSTNKGNEERQGAISPNTKKQKQEASSFEKKRLTYLKQSPAPC